MPTLLGLSGELLLLVRPAAYELRLGQDLVARLDGGAAALLPDAGTPLRELDLEAAIERAEDWLMPFSKPLEALELQVDDATGRVRRSLGGQARYTVDEVEQAFSRTHDAVVRSRVVDREGTADVVLLRELAHHGRLSRIVLRGPG